MPKPQLFHYAAGLVVLVAAAAALVGLVEDAERALVVLALSVASAVVVMVLADRRLQIGMERRSRESRALKEDIASLRAALSTEGTLPELGRLRDMLDRVTGAQDAQGQSTADIRSGLAGAISSAADLARQLTVVSEQLSAVRERVTAVEQQTASSSDRADQHFRSLDWSVRKLHPELLNDIQALDQLMARFAPTAPLPGLAGWAIDPVGLIALIDLIERTEAKTVVECGSGTSTLWIAMALRERGGGKVVALEHQEEYAARTRRVLEAHGLGDYAEVRYSPLVPTQTPRGEFQWYDFGTMPDRIDLLLVDGPPTATGKHARYPALPILRSALSPGAVIVADDAGRRDEREMIEFWLEEEACLARLGGLAPTMEGFTYASPESTAGRSPLEGRG